MKNLISYLFLFYFLTSSCLTYAQKQSNTWYFGTGVGLNFNVNPPQVLTNGKANSIEGCATFSDANGDLLFYSNGIKVVNKNHETMKNGDGILGDLSSTSNVLIIPQPGNDSLYYLFTIGSAGQDLKGFRYSVVNIKREGGLGEVIQKNVYFEEGCYEKLAAVRHCNNRDVWITIRLWDTDIYNTYLFTSSGLQSSPVVSHTGLIINGIPNNSLGALKFSADGGKLVAVHSFQNDCVELMNFNNATGVISNPVVFKPNTTPPSFTGVYGAEFSPDRRLLYISSNNSSVDPSTLYQFDITSMNVASILASRQVIAQTQPWFGGGLQAGPDNKIYYAMWKDTSLSVIEDPNVFGPGCNFRYNKILLSKTIPEPSQFGLPTFISSDLNAQYAPYNFSHTRASCIDFNISFQINRTTGIDSVLWDFGDGMQSTALAPVHNYLETGNYIVTLKIYNVNCGGNNTDVIIHNVSLSTYTNNFLAGDTSFCTYNNYVLASSVSAQQYLWNTGSTSPTIEVSDPGIYWLQIDNDGCLSVDSIVLSLEASLSVNLGKDTTVCVNKPVILNAGIAGAQYLWSTGESTKTIKISSPGIYKVEVSSDNKCSASDSVFVQWGDCDLFIPTAFSPNGDGLNETFGLVQGINATSFSMRIFNRFGQEVFMSKSQEHKWDGQFKNKRAPQGLYPWILHYTNKLGYPDTEKGSVLLIR